MIVSKPRLFLIALVVTGCQSSPKQTINQSLSNTTGSKTKVTVKTHSSTLTSDTVVVNNVFSLDVLAFNVFKADTNKIKSLFLDQVTLQIEKQKNLEGSSYDLYNLTDGTNKLILYNNNGFYVEEGNIKNNKILLNKEISIGMTKNIFLKLVKAADIKADTITVVNDESTFEAVYVFNHSKLNQIKMGQILE